MKKLSIEEKAHRYDEALRVVEKLHSSWKETQNRAADEIEEAFPELRESEDERIRGWIVDYLKFRLPDAGEFAEEYNIALNWLEKQKTTEEALRYLKENHSPSEVSDFQAAMNIAVAKAYNKGYTDGLEKQGGQKPADKVESISKDDEDESIRKDIIAYMRYERKSTEEEIENRFIPWLEKQGERDEECKEINLVEMLKHYPRETELYSPLYGKLWLAEVDEEHEIITCYRYPLEKDCTRAVIEQEDTVSFYSNGTTGLPDFSISKDCMLFLYNMEKQGEQKPKFRVGDTIKCKYDDRQFTIKSVDLDEGTYTYTQKGCGNDIDYADEEFELVEQKPADKFEPKFNVGDWVINSEGKIRHIMSVDESGYQTDYGWLTHDRYEREFHLWTVSDAKDGDVLATDNSLPFIYDKDRYNNGLAYYYAGLDVNGELTLKSPHHMLTHFGSLRGVIPATREQRDLLFSKMKDAGYEWDVEKKELKKIEPKPAWSEEDEKIKHELEVILANTNLFSVFALNYTFSDMISWLKSLKEKIQPQPKQELSEDAATTEYIDLGLPSGTLWKLFNEDGYYTYDEAVEKFMCNLPTKEQWEELAVKCKWVWKDNGYDVIGPNGNLIFLPAAGYRIGTEIHSVGTFGGYWSSAHYSDEFAYYMSFSYDCIYVDYYSRNTGRPVRLVK